MSKSSGGKGRSVERCTFCEKSRHHVQSLIAGPPGVYICNECIEICNTILKEESRKSGGSATFVKDLVLKDKIPIPEEIHRRLRHVMLTAFDEVHARAEEMHTDLRTAALWLGISRVSDALEKLGLYP